MSDGALALLHLKDSHKVGLYSVAQSVSEERALASVDNDTYMDREV